MEAILKKEIITDKTLCRAIGIILFVILISLGAFVRIPLPFTPVPLTLQTLFVLLAGAFMGSGPGALAGIIYIVLGVSGLPIFAGAGSGLFYLLGPTGGYMFGFILAAVLIGRFTKYFAGSYARILGLFFLADLLLLACGAVWLKVMLRCSFLKVFFIGFLPFVFGDLLKASFAAFLYLKLKPRLKAIF
jgi:biotin transport system substrate-specific component